MERSVWFETAVRERLRVEITDWLHRLDESPRIDEEVYQKVREVLLKQVPEVEPHVR